MVLTAFLFAGAMVAANGQKDGADGQTKLKFVTWDDVMFEYIVNVQPIGELYRESHPNITIEIEKSEDSESYEQTMQIRAAAGELPDIMPLKPYMLDKYKDYMSPLNNHPSADKNKFASMYSIDGNIIGLPIASFNEFVYYRKSLFAELGLEIPATWGEFLNILETVKDDGRYIPLAVGLKDAWPDYPFNEFMPLLEAGNGNYYNDIAQIEKPFTKGQPFYDSYRKIQDLMDKDVMGKDPLGMGWDEVKYQFSSGKAVMLAAGQWYIADYVENLGGDIDDLGIFFLPVRDKVSEPFYATVMADTFLGIPKDSKNGEAASEFIRWFFDEYYRDFLPFYGVSSTVNGIEVSGNPVLEQIPSLEQPEFILVEAESAAFAEIKNAIQFDVKRIGQEMAAGYYDSFDALMMSLNEDWSEALQ